MGFLRVWRKHFQRRKEQAKPQVAPRQEHTFSEYLLRLKDILTYMRREAGVPRRSLELLVIDEPEQPAWKVEEALEHLSGEAKLLYVATDRPACFQELQEEILEETGLLLVFVPFHERAGWPANLELDLREWEKQLDVFGGSGL